MRTSNRTRRISADVLFEIGTEELPATALADIFESSAETGSENSMLSRLRSAFEAERLGFRNCRAWATPRRLVFWIQGVATAQSAKEEVIKGPSRQDAYGADGVPTEKLLGFLKAKKADPKDIQIESAQGREYVFLRQRQPSKKAPNVLPAVFERLVKTIPFSKTMRWDDSGVVFSRPIRSLLCIYQNKPLRFRVGHLQAGNQTFVFSRGERATYRVKDAPSYFGLLEKRGVVLDPAERKKAIQKILEKLAAASGGQLHGDPFLLNEVNYLVEIPHGIAASFDPEFLALPPEVLTVSMARKQRLFGVVGRDGKIIPKFLAILDGVGSPKDERAISENYEHILRAKLQDSLFFFEEDKRVSLEMRQPQLEEMPFLGHAGSMLEKSQRLVRLAKNMASRMGLSEEEKIALTRAAQLGKADLLTHMVGEFPELQGVMGRYYALAGGEKSSVAAQAIGEQYLPRTAQDRLPESLPGSLLSIVDKCDLISACFGLGLEPSSSLDPYGLRRSAGAVMRIVLDNKIGFSLLDLIDDTVKQLDPYILADRRAALGRRLRALFEDRFLALLVERGFRKDLVEAVMATDFSSPFEAFRRLEALSAIAGGEEFARAWKVVERTVNILKGNREKLPERVEPALFAEDLERRVYEHYERSQGGIREATAAGDFGLATSLYAAAFFDILSEFFGKVFVNTDDLQVRKNRLALLAAVRDLYTEKIADLSKIQFNKETAAQ